MADFDNTNRGVLFKNDRKETDNHPDYTGKIDVGGIEYWLSAWIKTGQRGKFMSLSIKPKDVQPQRAPDPQSISQRATPRGPAPYQVRDNDPITSGPQRNDMDDDIPF